MTLQKLDSIANGRFVSLLPWCLINGGRLQITQYLYKYTRDRSLHVMLYIYESCGKRNYRPQKKKSLDFRLTSILQTSPTLYSIKTSTRHGNFI